MKIVVAFVRTRESGKAFRQIPSAMWSKNTPSCLIPNLPLLQAVQNLRVSGNGPVLAADEHFSSSTTKRSSTIAP